MTYSDFLFSKLFMEYNRAYNTDYKDMEYDLLFGVIKDHMENFLASPFNDESESEYNCISNYLSHRFVNMQNQKWIDGLEWIDGDTETEIYIDTNNGKKYQVSISIERDWEGAIEIK